MTQYQTTATADRFTAMLTTSFHVWGGLRHSLRRMAARRQLEVLDNRLLRDIGIDRSDIAADRF